MSISESSRVAITLANYPEMNPFVEVSGLFVGLFCQEQDRRVLCDAYIARQREIEEQYNVRHEEALSDFQEFDSSVGDGLPEDLLNQQRCFYEAANAQALLHQELNERFGFEHMAFCMRDRARNFETDRWFKVLSETPFGPDFSSIDKAEIADFKSKIKETAGLDSLLFEPQEKSPRLIQRFITHVSQTLRRDLISPLLKKLALPEEPGKLESARAQILELKKADRCVLYVHALFEFFLASKRLEEGHFAKLLELICKPGKKVSFYPAIPESDSKKVCAKVQTLCEAITAGKKQSKFELHLQNYQAVMRAEQINSLMNKLKNLAIRNVTIDEVKKEFQVYEPENLKSFYAQIDAVAKKALEDLEVMSEKFFDTLTLIECHLDKDFSDIADYAQTLKSHSESRAAKSASTPILGRCESPIPAATIMKAAAKIPASTSLAKSDSFDMPTPLPQYIKDKDEASREMGKAQFYNRLRVYLENVKAYRPFFELFVKRAAAGSNSFTNLLKSMAR